MGGKAGIFISFPLLTRYSRYSNWKEEKCPGAHGCRRGSVGASQAVLLWPETSRVSRWWPVYWESEEEPVRERRRV